MRLAIILLQAINKRFTLADTGPASCSLKHTCRGWSPSCRGCRQICHRCSSHWLLLFAQWPADVVLSMHA